MSQIAVELYTPSPAIKQFLSLCSTLSIIAEKRDLKGSPFDNTYPLKFAIWKIGIT